MPKKEAFKEFTKEYRRIGVYMMKIGMTGMISFVKSKPIGTQRWSSIGERKYLSDLYIVYPV
jgi:hypothetical protein